MERKTFFVNVVLPVPVPGTFTYRVPYDLNDSVKVGQRAVVQFGKTKIMSGLISVVTEQVPDFEQVKYILGILDNNPVVSRNITVPISYPEDRKDISVSYPLDEVELRIVGRKNTINSLSAKDNFCSSSFLFVQEEITIAKRGIIIMDNKFFLIL